MTEVASGAYPHTFNAEYGGGVDQWLKDSFRWHCRLESAERSRLDTERRRAEIEAARQRRLKVGW